MDRYATQVKRAYRNGLIVLSGLVAALLLVGIPIGLWKKIPVWLLAPLGSLHALYGARVQRRLHAQLQAASFRLCPGCGYDLRGVGEAGCCPECSRPFQAESLIEDWAAAGVTSRTRLRELYAIESARSRTHPEASSPPDCGPPPPRPD